MRGSNICLIGGPAKENEDHCGEAKFEELKVEKFPYLKKDRSPQIL